MILQTTIMMLTGYNPNKVGGAGIETLYFGTHGHTSRPTDSPANTYFEPRISNPGSFLQTMFQDGTTGGSSSGGFGYIELVNTDGGLDHLADWGFDERPCKILYGVLGDSLLNFKTLLIGTVEQVEHSWDKITLRFKDKTLALNKPIALNFYLGNNALPNGVEGVSDLKGKPKPRLFGTAFNIEPVCVNTSKLIYQFNDGSGTITSVRDSGVAITQGTFRASVTDLINNAPTAGTYDYCPSAGYIRLGSSPVGQVTMNCSGLTGSMWYIVNTIVLEKFTASEIVLNSLYDLQTTDFGYYTGTNELTTKEVLDDLGKMGFWWGFDNNGSFWAKLFSAPDAANTILELDKSSMLSIERLATMDDGKGVPVWKVNCRYSKNYAVQSTLAASASVGVYDKEWLDAVYEDATIKTKHPLATELIIDSPYSTYAEAVAEAERQFNLRSVRRDRLKVKVSSKLDGPIKYSDKGYWDDQAITEYPLTVAHPGSFILDDYLYVLGGYNAVSFTVVSHKLDLNATGKAWGAGAVTDLELAGSTFAALSSTHLYVTFESASYVGRLPLSNLSGSWASSTEVTQMPTPTRTDYTMHIYNDRLIIIGGLVYDSYCATDCIISLDLTNPTGAWSTTAITQPPKPIAMHTSCIHDGFLYLLGGFADDDTAYPDVRRIDLANPTGSWESLASLPSGVHWGCADVLDGVLVLIGGGAYGGSSSYTTCRTLDLSDPSAVWSDSNMSDLPSGRRQATMQRHTNAAGYESLYTVGGFLLASTSSNSWRFRTLTNVDDFSQLTSLGRTVTVTMPRYGYDTGRPMKIIGVESDYSTAVSTLELWG